MNLNSLIVVVLRLMALDFVLRFAVHLIPQIIQFLRFYGRSPLDGSSSFFALPWLLLAGLIIAAVFLWFFAPTIARFVTRGVSHELSFGAMSLMDCYSVSFVSVGLFYICSHLPQVLNSVHHLLKTSASGPGDSGQGMSGYDISQAVIPFIVGLALFVNGRRWAVALALLQAERPTSTAMVVD